MSTRKLVADWPKYLSYDIADEEIKKFFSEKEGIVTKNYSIFYGKKLLDVFLFAMAIGKYKQLSSPLKKKSQTIPMSALSQEQIWLMTSVALSEKNSDLDILSRPSDIAKICEEYANGGVRIMIAMDINKSIAEPLAEYEEFIEKVFKEQTSQA